MAPLTGLIRFAHLYRRAGFGASEAEINAAIALAPGDENLAYAMAVDKLVNYETTSDFVDRIVTDGATNADIPIQWWLERMLRSPRQLVEKMAFFWHDHFATSLEKDGEDIPKMLAQNALFRTSALGNFRQLLKDVSRNPAMILWLDLNTNRRTSPNENWMRELLELFALGIGTPESPNYTEDDIRQGTRAFTGYTIDANGNFFLNTSQHDSGTKTVLGQTCESGDQVIDILTQYQKSGEYVCARYICAKLFSFFAYPVEPEAAEVTPLAATFMQNSLFSIRAVVQQILLSTDFQSTQAYRSRIKSPVEVAVGALRMMGAERVPTSNVMNRLRDQGQRLFWPPDVGGWPSGHAWINASTVLSRCNMAASIINSMGNTDVNQAGGSLAVAFIPGGTATAQEKVDRILSMLVDGNIATNMRDQLISYIAAATTDERRRGMFNLIMAQPEFQLA